MSGSVRGRGVGVAVAAAAVLALAPAVAGAQTTHDVGVIEDDPVETFLWSPEQVSADTGDTVRWFFDPTVSPGTSPITAVHNVEIRAGSQTGTVVDESDFFSPPNPDPSEYEYTFQEAGTFFYICIVHATTMVGQVEVEGPPAGEAELDLAAEPSKRVVKPGRQASFRAVIANVGEAAAENVEVCVKAKKRLVAIKGERCRAFESLAVDASEEPKFTLKAKRRARGKKITVRFNATADNAASATASAILKVKR